MIQRLNQAQLKNERSSGALARELKGEDVIIKTRLKERSDVCTTGGGRRQVFD